MENKKNKKEPKGILYMMCGMPGSGKSTLATNIIKKQPEIKYVSRDTIRLTMVSDQAHFFDKESDVYREFCNQISMYLQQGKAVIADATHLTKKSRQKLLNNIYPPASVRCVYMRIPFKVAFARNAARKGITRVPDDQMYKMKNRFQPPSPSEGFDLIYTVNG